MHNHTRSGWGLAAALAIGLTLTAPETMAQISIHTPDTTYVQDFNDLASSGQNSWSNNSTLAGWYSNKLSYGTAFRNLGYPVMSYGVTGTNNASDRALGMSLTATPSDTAYVRAQFVNHTGLTLYSADVSFYGEQYFSAFNDGTRFTGGMLVYTAINPSVTYPSVEWTQQNALTFNPGPFSDTAMGGYLYTSNFQSAFALDGNHANFRTLISGTILFAGGLAPGSEFQIMWGNSNYGIVGDAILSDGLAIDDVNVTFRSTVSAVPEPSAFAMWGGLMAMGFTVARRRPHCA